MVMKSSQALILTLTLVVHASSDGFLVASPPIIRDPQLWAEPQNVAQDQAHASQQQQQWLDLRSTALSPHEALVFLRDNLFSTMAVDTVLVSPQGHSKHLAFEQQQQQQKEQQQPIQEQFPEPKIVYVDSDGLLWQSHPKNDDDDNNGRPAVLFGQTMCVPNPQQHGALFDPLLAMTATSSGQWILVDSDGRSNDDHEANAEWWTQQVNSLVDFLSSSMGHWIKAEGDESSDDKLLLVPTEDDSSSWSPSTGGMAVTCETSHQLLQWMSIMMEQSSSRRQGRVTSTDSGILLSDCQNDEVQKSTSTLKTALVLPFDLALWKTALDLRLMDEGSDERCW